MSRTGWQEAAAIAAMVLGAFTGHTPAQTVPQSVQQAQIVHIPLAAIAQPAATPIKDLTEADFSLKIDGQPRAFQLSRPWSSSVNPKTDEPQDRPNLLIILPLGVPLDRKEALDRAIAALSLQPELDWNISILDDAGNQTHYTRGLKKAIASLKSIENENPGGIGLDDWRSTATLAIAGMRDLPGRRVVMSLGDIFHEVLVDHGQLLYEAFQVDDVATAARNSGAIIYAAESSAEIDQLRELPSYFSVTGTGPWLLQTRDGNVAGWISGPILGTMDDIRRDGMGAYNIDLHLSPEQMDGQLHVVAITPHRAHIILEVPQYYVAPDLARLQQFARVSPALRHALKVPPRAGSSPLELATQLAYFPHRDGLTGTQIATTGFFWNSATLPPAKLETALRLEQSTNGYVLNTTIRQLQWSSELPVWNAALDVIPGAYMLRVAAADASGKISAAAYTPFTIEPATGDQVLISSVVLGKSCVLAPQLSDVAPGQKNVDYLRAGSCDLRPDPTHEFSPQEIVWTLVRITPVGKLAARPAKDWKASFELVDAAGSKRAEEPVHWLAAEDGSFVATTAFPLDHRKLNLANGEYAIVFRLKGPGIERDYGEDASFAVYDAKPAP